jgi:hypothetical protein
VGLPWSHNTTLSAAREICRSHHHDETSLTLPNGSERIIMTLRGDTHQAALPRPLLAQANDLASTEGGKVHTEEASSSPRNHMPCPCRPGIACIGAATFVRVSEPQSTPQSPELRIE